MNSSAENSSLKGKKLLLATWGCGDKEGFHRRDWIPLFKKMFGKLVVFVSRDHFFYYGKKALNKEFLKIIKDEKPDYLLFSISFFGEFNIETIAKIKEISPQTKTVIEFGDDDWRFDDWSRYYALFFDYIITTKVDIRMYKRDKIFNVRFLHGSNPYFFKPMNLKKEYDVTFIGSPIADRYDYIKFLKENGINIQVFGTGWEKYSDLNDVYKGPLYNEDFPGVINKSKINLNFSKTFYKKGKSGQLKSRIFDVTSCGSFLLNEYTDKNVKMISGKKEINFRSKRELLEKIKYYLKNEEEREKIALEVHKDIVKNYSWKKLFSDFFNDTEKDNPGLPKLPEIDKKIAKISDKELGKTPSELKKTLESSDYVVFEKKGAKYLPYRNYFQAYSLFITKKQISCCDSYIHSPRLGNFMVSMSKKAFYSMNEDDFSKMLNISQLMVTKNFFLENFETFKKSFYGEKIKLISEKNTAFVSIPLIITKEIPSADYEHITKFFHMLFIYDLSRVFFHKKILNPYIIGFLIEFLFGKPFIRKYLFNYLQNKGVLVDKMTGFARNR